MLLQMKKANLLLVLCVLGYFGLNAQEIVVAGWTFPGNEAAADTGVVANVGIEISTTGGTSAIDFKNGCESKAAQATGWDNGLDAKAWEVYFSTEGFTNLTLSSRQQSGGNEPGPKDYKIQVSIDEGLNWTDVENGTVTVENDWETSFVDNLPLPENCSNKPMIKVRWIMASNDASGSAGGVVQEDGKTKIDEIYIRGEQVSGTSGLVAPVFEIYPNPATGRVNITTAFDGVTAQIINSSGQLTEQKRLSQLKRIDVSAYPKGLYFVSFVDKSGVVKHVEKLIVK
jgi:hypothetical protein